MIDIGKKTQLALIFLIILANSAFASLPTGKIQQQPKMVEACKFSYTMQNGQFQLACPEYTITLDTFFETNEKELSFREFLNLSPIATANGILDKQVEQDQFKWGYDIQGLSIEAQKNSKLTIKIGFSGKIGENDFWFNQESNEIVAKRGEIVIDFSDLVASGYLVLFNSATSVSIKNTANKERLLLDPTVKSWTSIKLNKFTMGSCQLFGDYVAAFWHTVPPSTDAFSQITWALSEDRGLSWTLADYNVMNDTNAALGAWLNDIYCYFNKNKKKLVVTTGISEITSTYINEITYSADPHELLHKLWEVGDTNLYGEYSSYGNYSVDVNADAFLCVYREKSVLGVDRLIRVCVDTDYNVINTNNRSNPEIVQNPFTHDFDLRDDCSSHDGSLTMFTNINNYGLHPYLYSAGSWTISDASIQDNNTYVASNCDFSQNDDNLFIVNVSRTKDLNLCYCNNPSTANCDENSEWHCFPPTAWNNDQDLYQPHIVVSDNDDVFVFAQNRSGTNEVQRAIWYDNNASWSSVVNIGGDIGLNNWTTPTLPLPKLGAKKIPFVGVSYFDEDTNSLYYYSEPLANITSVRIAGDLNQSNHFAGGNDVNLSLQIYDSDSNAQSFLVDLNLSTSKDPGTGIIVFSDFNLSKDFNLDTNSLNLPIGKGADFNYAFNLPSLDNNYYACVSLFDAVNNDEYSACSVLSFIIDSTKPTTAWDGNHSTWQRWDANMSFTCVDSGGCSTTYWQRDSDPSIFVSWETWQSGNVLSLPWPGHIDGNFGVRFYSSDLAGQDGDYNRFFVLIDKFAPRQTSFSPDSNSNTADTTPNFSVVFSDTNTNSDSGLATCGYRVFDYLQEYKFGSVAVVANSCNYSLEFDLPDHNLAFVDWNATDVVGNTSNYYRGPSQTYYVLSGGGGPGGGGGGFMAVVPIKVTVPSLVNIYPSTSVVYLAPGEKVEYKMVIESLSDQDIPLDIVPSENLLPYLVQGAKEELLLAKTSVVWKWLVMADGDLNATIEGKFTVKLSEQETVDIALTLQPQESDFWATEILGLPLPFALGAGVMLGGAFLALSPKKTKTISLSKVAKQLKIR